ncbi:hypothetical protein [Buttiauxella sp. 3AFRM03]|uniref:hypothetical protein n=1 Tax=Buttiauxella sp. 3AFRM03 TaxID=2479367 RepID=UPI00138FAFF7|nr:hypothetical protein [Buttiauxella sp. 3AFRM03]
MLISGCNDSPANKPKIRFVDIDRVLKESGLAEQKTSHLKAVHESLLLGAEKAKANYNTLSKDKRQQAMAADAQMLNMQWRAEQQTANQLVLKAVKESAENWMKSGDVAAILPMQSALAVAAEGDITTDIAAQLKNKKVVFNELPQMTLKSDTVDVKKEPKKAK